jgi:Glycosyl hydrolase family 20, catalytic domain
MVSFDDAVPRRRRLWLTISAGLMLVSGLIVHQVLLRRPQQQQDDGNFARRRLQEKERARRRNLPQPRTLDPKEKANIVRAHEMVMDALKARGVHIPEDQADPFQTMREKTITNSTQHTKDKLSLDHDALEKLRSSTQWENMDPLMETVSVDELEKSLPFIDWPKSQLKYLGVTVDAGRNHFPVPWLKRLIVYLHKMNYNCLLLRLSDDERFSVKLDSYPQLATANSSQEEFFSPAELKDLVAFGEQHDIVIIPEIQLPLRVASWARIPGLIMDCPNFICETGHYLPLNLEHPDLTTILERVLHEILAIFNNPPMLHLGGPLSIYEAQECVEEATGYDNPTVYWDKWERVIKEVLNKIGYPEEQVIRTASYAKASDNIVKRVGGIEHHWVSLPGAWSVLSESIVSTGLDFGLDDDNSAWQVYLKTRQLLNFGKKQPIGIIVGTLYLSTDLIWEQNTWMHRNVLARLVAVAMGVADKGNNFEKNLAESDFLSAYQTTCRSLLPDAVCALQGHTVLSTQSLINMLGKRNHEWRGAICSQLTTVAHGIVLQRSSRDRTYAHTMGNQVFWKDFHRLPTPYQPTTDKGSKQQSLVDPVKELKHAVDKTGVIFDLANSLAKVNEVRNLIEDYIGPLGMDWLQLRLSDDFAFAARLENNVHLGQSMWVEENPVLTVPKIGLFKSLVNAANAWNMEIVPEISISTNAGGWVNGGFLVPCTKKFCKEGTGIPNNIQDPQFLPLVYAVLRELREIFGSSPYLHLGADERVDNLKCFEELGLKDDEDPPFGEFEVKLKKMLRMLGVKPDVVIRYDNDEQLTYEDRTGSITQYRVTPDGRDPDIRKGEPYLVTVGLLDGTIYSVYLRTRSLAALKPMGLLGEIQTLNRTIWKNENMGLRLIALVVGFSVHVELLAQKDFVKEVIRICQAVKFPDYLDDPECTVAETLLKMERQKKGDDDDAVDSAPEKFPIAAVKFRDALCAKFTRPQNKLVVREEFRLSKKEREKTGMSVMV